MAKTKAIALKEKRKFEKKYPYLKCIIVDDSNKFPRGNGLRYNFRFKRR